MKSQQSTNAFVKETFMDLKTKLETIAKNHQASIQKLETKFDRLDDKQSGRPSGSLPSNTQPNPKGHNSKVYQPPQSCNEHVNAVFTRSGKSYNPPVNSDDQQTNPENPINFDNRAEKSKNLHHNRKFKIQNQSKKLHYPNHTNQKSPDFVILEMEEDSKVPLILGRPFLHTVDAGLFSKKKSCEYLRIHGMTAVKNLTSESDTEDPPFITINTDYKIKTSLEEPPTDLELKPLPDNLEYVFLEEPSFLPIIISSQLSKEKKQLIYVLKRPQASLVGRHTDSWYLPIILQTQDTTSG
ncbi:hypothetical protein Tco_0430953 [Tanacetum coccineum]